MTDTRYSPALADELCRRISEGTPLPATHYARNNKNRGNDMTDTRYSVALADELCRRISEGTPLRQAVREIEGAPPEATVRGWVRDNREGFAARYEAARRLQADAWADELVLLANRDDLDP